MSEQLTQRRGPLLWLADLVRHRPVAAIVLALLLVLTTVASLNWAILRSQQQRARERQMQAQQVRERLKMLGRKLHERSLEQKPLDDTP